MSLKARAVVFLFGVLLLLPSQGMVQTTDQPLNSKSESSASLDPEVQSILSNGSTGSPSDPEVKAILSNGSTGSPLDPEVQVMLSRIKANHGSMKTMQADVVSEHTLNGKTKAFHFHMAFDFVSNKIHMSTKDGIPMDVVMDGTDIYIKGKDGIQRKVEHSEKTKNMLKDLLGESFNQQELKDVLASIKIENQEPSKQE